MAIYKRGKIYWYKFMWQNRSVRESTKQGNDKVARQMEAAHRTSLAKGEVGIREKKPVPTLGEFCEVRVKPWAKSTYESAAPKTWQWYLFALKSVASCKILANRKLSEIGGEEVADFVAFKQSQGLQIS